MNFNNPQKTFCKSLPVLVAQGGDIETRIEALSASNAKTQVEGLLVTIMSFNLFGGSAAPMMSRKPTRDAQGRLDRRSKLAAAKSQTDQFVKVIQGALTPVWAPGEDTTLVTRLIEAQPEFDKIDSAEEAQKARDSYAQLVQTCDGINRVLASKSRETWMATSCEELKSLLEETSTIVDNLGDYLQHAAPVEGDKKHIETLRNELAKSFERGNSVLGNSVLGNSLP